MLLSTLNFKHSEKPQGPCHRPLAYCHCLLNRACLFPFPSLRLSPFSFSVTLPTCLFVRNYLILFNHLEVSCMYHISFSLCISACNFSEIVSNHIVQAAFEVTILLLRFPKHSWTTDVFYDTQLPCVFIFHNHIFCSWKLANFQSFLMVTASILVYFQSSILVY